MANGGQLRPSLPKTSGQGLVFPSKQWVGFKVPFLGGSTGLDYRTEWKRGSVPLPTWHSQMDQVQLRLCKSVRLFPRG